MFTVEGNTIEGQAQWAPWSMTLINWGQQQDSGTDGDGVAQSRGHCPSV
jgi:hypothetical protein